MANLAGLPRSSGHHPPHECAENAGTRPNPLPSLKFVPTALSLNVDGSPGCEADSAVDAGRSPSPDLGSELGKSGSATTAVAPAPHGAGTYADHPLRQLV